MKHTTYKDKFLTVALSALGCLFVSLLMGFLAGQKQDSEHVQSQLNTYLEESYQAVKSQIEALPPSEINFDAIDASIYDVFIQRNDSAYYWNNFLTPVENIYKSKSDYIIKYKDQTGDYTKVIGLDLTEKGKGTEHLLQKFNLSVTSTALPSDVTIEDYLHKKFSYQIKESQSFSILLSSSLIFYFGFLILLLVWVYKMHIKNRSPKPIILILGLIFLWILQTYLVLPSFSSSYLATISSNNSGLNPNFLHLLSNLIFITGIFHFWKASNRSIPSLPWLYQILAPFILTACFIYTCHLAHGFISGSPIHFQYGELVQYTFPGFLYILVFIYILTLIFYASVVFFKSIPPVSDAKSKYLSWAAGILITIPFCLFLDVQIPLWTIYTFVISYLLILELYLENSDRQITYAFWWIIILSGFLASITFYYRLKDSIIAQTEQISELYTAPSDKSTQTVFQIDSSLQSSDLFLQLSALEYPSRLDKNDFKDYILKIISENSISQDNYEVSLEATDNQEVTLFNNHFSTSYAFSQSISSAELLSDFVYFNPFDNAYFLDYQIENETYRHSPLRLRIKITFDDSKEGIEDTPFNYVIYKKDVIIKSHFKNNAINLLGALASLKESGIEGDVSYSVFKPNEEVKIIAYNKIGGLIKPISLFSFIVSISAILLFLLAFINTNVHFLPAELNLKFYDTSSLRTRIQLTIIMLIVFSFFIIGIVTAFYFKNVLENNNLKTQREEVRKIINDIQTNIEGVDNNFLAAATLQGRIQEMAHIHDKNLVFFDHTGKKQKASFRTPKIDRVPYQLMRNFATAGSKKTSPRIDLEGGNYTIDFIPVYYKTKTPYGFLGISYQPINNSNQSIRDFLSTILNVYIFLFLIAGALAIAIGNSITKPLSILSRKLKDFKLGKSDQALDWDTKDEIGKLIKEYNLLTKKLDESANMLARTERDIAWREMAKQVAHEIKNPLTPMKLSIQYLEKAVQSNPDRAKELIERVSSTLIEQINNLNQIANEFSNFATMPKASNEKIIINEIVEAIHDLFRKREDMDIQMSEPIDDLYVFADRNHLVRILNNIVKNAIQAIPTDKKGIIQMSLTKKGDKVVISVKDNGTGIPDHMKEKVFTPNFTTKSSGTGLGLAISANMIESFNGRIYFETELGVGTEFFIEIPLMRLQDNFPDQNRVMLE